MGAVAHGIDQAAEQSNIHAHGIAHVAGRVVEQDCGGVVDGQGDGADQLFAVFGAEWID
ncbi:hypothetical protein [Pseudomonas shirazica]|uniref:hypothetical protein n=1 Tax=Pseudomonas shirazica TaxID=1940636 RepID=UPI001C258FEF|nr:hypothetical protein [Pseudomonas shirazica]